MVSTVKSRPSHYEVLGVSPAAGAAEIKAAFARRMSLFGIHPMAAGAQICAAYETLRDPERRRAYDRSLGLAAGEAQYRPWAMTARVPRAAPFIASPAARPEPAAAVAMPAIEPAAAVAMPAVEVDPQALASAEPRTGSAIAESLRGLAASGPYRPPSPAPKPEPERAPEPEGAPEPLPQLAEEDFAEAEPGAIQWRRPAAIAGALVLGVGLFGAWAGWESGNDVEAAQAEPAVTLAVPPPAARQAEAPEPAALAASAPQARTEPRRVAAAQAPARRALPRPIPLTPAEERELAGNAFVDSATQQAAAASAADALAPAPSEPAAAVTAAKLPLPNSVVARTIGRIGYSCGQVASTTPVDGAPGVFTVTCTSGHSYRAQPVRGRYRFKRLGGN